MRLPFSFHTSQPVYHIEVKEVEILFEDGEVLYLGEQSSQHAFW